MCLISSGWVTPFTFESAQLWAQLVLASGGVTALALTAWAGSDAGRPNIRQPILAGRWYEADSAALARSIEDHLEDQSESRAVPLVPPRAVVVPHAGHYFSGDCAGAAFRLLRESGARRVILLGPSHRVAFAGAAVPREDAFATPLGPINLDRKALTQLRARPGFLDMPAAHAREHSLEIELPFLQKVLPQGFTLVPLVIGRLDEEQVAAVGGAIAEIWDEMTVLVVSSDFTHFGPTYGYTPFHGPEAPQRVRELDHEAIGRILAMDREGLESLDRRHHTTICGLNPLRLLLEAASGRDLHGQLIDYRNSADKNGDYDNLVSYAALAFFPPQRTDDPGPAAVSRDAQAELLVLARRAVLAHLDGQPLPRQGADGRPEGAGGSDEAVLREHRGVFVTLKDRHGRLRGCIGNIQGDEPLRDGVVRNAVAAASRDPRFVPVTRSELSGLRFEISVLTPLRKIDGPRDIVLGRDGVVLEKGRHRAVFLPQVAPEQGWGLEEMLDHLATKAGLRPRDWREGAAFFVFQAQSFHEEEPGAVDGGAR